ncbi:hypothetical protein M8494_18480 [Serratia ureilytica]
MRRGMPARSSACIAALRIRQGASNITNGNGSSPFAVAPARSRARRDPVQLPLPQRLR